MSNANRDYAIVYDVKNSSLVLSRPLVFYITDQNTSNIFVRLVTKVNIGDGIDKYTDIEEASSYALTMRVIKPNNEVNSIEATQHEKASIFQFDLTEDFKDIPGKYICELTISTIVSERQELITSDSFNYEVKRSILSNISEIIETEDTTVEKLLNNLEASKIRLFNDLELAKTNLHNDLDATKTELSSQIKDITNVADLAQEGSNVYIKDSNGNKVGNGITIQSSSTGSGGNITSSSDYSYEYMGTPFPALNAYQSWPIAGIQYDKSIDRIVCLVTDVDKHVNSTQFKLSLYTLNPQTAEIKLIQTLKDNTADPVVNLSDAFHSQRGFLIDNDTGIYYKFHFGDDNIPKACKSEDKGITWTDITINETNTAWTVGGNGQIIKTSTGRIICGLFGNGVAYTDDYFANITYCNNTKLPSNGENTCHEYEIIEYPDGTLQRLMRRTWQSTDNGVWNGTKVVEPAWVSTSTDNGVTWTTPIPSTSVVNMSATNCVSYIDGDILNLFVACRYPVTSTSVSAMFYYQCSLDDAKIDNFGTPTTIFYGNTNDYINFGNLAGCKDDKGNFHLFYNDNALSAMGSDECRWHYIRISKETVNNNLILDEPVNKIIQAYNANSIDNLLNAVYDYINSVKNELLIKIGEMPDSGTVDNPTYWVSDGLISMFTIAEANFDTSNSKFTPTVGNYSLYVAGGDYDYSAQSTYSNLYLYSNDKNLLKDTFINSAEGYTIEVDYLTRYEDGSGAGRPFNLNSSGGIGFVSTWNINLLSYSTTSNSSKAEATAGIKDNFDSTRNRNTLTFVYDRINNKSSVYANGTQILTSEGLTVTDGNSWDIADVSNSTSFVDRLTLMKGQKTSIRCYNKPLTAEQILTNANYSNKLT